MATTEGSIANPGGFRRERIAAVQLRRDRAAAAVRLLAFIIATSFGIAMVMAVVLALVLQRLAAYRG